MSIVAMNWAWGQQVAPTAKLVLMALADAADDHGICWPSVTTVATKCCVSDRTVRRVMQRLIAHDLLIAEPRYRPDGSCSSNRYRLLLGGGDNLSPGPDAGDTTPCPVRQGPPDTAVRPRTTKVTEKESPLPPTTETGPVVFASAENSGGDLTELDFPKGLSPSERVEARKRLANLPMELALQIVDELAGRMEAGVIQVSPLAYLRGLIQRAHAGEFTPEAALRVAEQRKRRHQAEAALRQVEAVRTESPPPDTVDADNPLIRRLTILRDNARSRNRRNE
jgi:hypothetical protein